MDVSPGSGSLIHLSAWRALEGHRASLGEPNLAALFADDDERARRLCVEHEGLLLDYSKNLVTDETLALLQKHRNVFADLARMTKNPWATWNALLSAQALSDGASNVMERLLFASGWPAESPARAIETLYSLNTFSQGSHLPTIPRATIHSIIERDTLKALGIERAPGHSMNGHGSHASKTMQSNIDDAVTKATLD